MSFQILEIALYSNSGEVRTIPFRTGQLNIITGASETGKTALIGIIDYCLGSGDCRIPVGVIRQSVSWVGIKLHLFDGQAFIARKLPPKGVSISSDIYYQVGKVIETPVYEELRQTINLEGLGNILTQLVGIRDNIHYPPLDQTRNPLSANIRHALLFSFQHQTEIDNDKNLFHRQSEPYMVQTIKDILPYFLGAINDDYIEKLKTLRKIKQDIRNVENRIAENERILGDGLSRAQILLNEAKSVGLSDISEIPSTWLECVFALQLSINQVSSLEDSLSVEGDIFNGLQDLRSSLVVEFRQTKAKLQQISELQVDKRDYEHEAYAQLNRLESISLFDEKLDQILKACPLCDSNLTDEYIPKVDDIKTSYNLLKSQVRSFEEQSPQMDQLILSLKGQLDNLKEKIKENTESLEAIQVNNQKFQQIQEQSNRRSYILGRIGLYLENIPSVNSNTDLQKNLFELISSYKILDEELSRDQIQDKLDSILYIVNKSISDLESKLNLKVSEYLLRFDIKKLILMGDNIDGPVTMDKIGSGKNWVAFHLITHFAFHEWFVNRNRPTPRFLFIDQPSQVFFPEDIDSQNVKIDYISEDSEAVKNMYKLAYDVVNKLHPNFQVIMTDHANIDEPWFQEAIVERWRDGKKLVPLNWID